jgi:hypothetical protein
MKRILVYVLIVVIACMVVVGCQKKVTKTPEPVQKTSPVKGPGAPPRF